MKKIIEELYFGSINMQETINSASIPEYKKLEGMKADAMVIDYANIFKEGFRLGAKLMLEILEN